ncbi:hypothetical protein LJR234_000350 [Mesorhizobium amorphae]|uniref:hypothetical protein n=1 Tax=Mesorhizobium amorphae TaxID=71433 RepID=UPI003ED08F9A
MSGPIANYEGEQASWAKVVTCRDLASDLLSLRPDIGGQIVAPLHASQRDLLVAILTRESNRAEDALVDLFNRGIS